MRVIGTAGHVDHGKTTLIEALTGINTDRLPEEKARGMTIDLGFAWFAGPGGEPIGVIDVPGHERFIRNMVAGAWSLDCALLLVAADDGWMQQTQDHAVVLAALGVPAVVLVVTKIDADAPGRVEEVRRDAIARATALFGFEPRVAEVAALARRGVDELRGLIVDALDGLVDGRAEPRVPYLYVDRVFTIKGSGLVVTGSLRGGEIRVNDELLLLPRKETVRVRGMQTYNAAVDVARPTCRLALNLPKTRGEISRGDCLTMADAPFSCESTFVARITPVETGRGASADADDAPVIRNHGEVEIALGTGHEIAQIHFMDDRRFARVEMRAPLPALWNQPFLVIRHGGSTLLGTGRVLWHGDPPREVRHRLSKVLGTFPDRLEPDDRTLLDVRFSGLARRPDGELPRRVAVECTVDGPWMFHADWLAAMTATIRGLAGQPAGVSLTELEGKLRIDADALKRVLGLLVQRSSLFLSNGLYFAKTPGDARELGASARRLMAEIDRLGAAGFESSRSGIEGAQKDLKTLIRLGLVVPLEGGVCYGRATYEALARTILEGRRAGDRFSIPEAKERTGLSRKYMIPLLNRMEKDGALRRDGDARIVLRTAAPGAPDQV